MSHYLRQTTTCCVKSFIIFDAHIKSNVLNALWVDKTVLGNMLWDSKNGNVIHTKVWDIWILKPNFFFFTF